MIATQRTGSYTVLRGWLHPAGNFDARVVRCSEWLLLVYFLYVATCSAWTGPDASEWILHDGIVAAGIALLLALVWLDTRTHSLLVSCVRDWLPPALVLLAYWSVDWFHPRKDAWAFDSRWIGLDRTLLHAWGGKAAVESLGATLPFLLELSYCLLYAVTPVCVGILYRCRRRRRVDLFLSTLLLGTLTTYAILPFFPSTSPRLAFPGTDLPAYHTGFRTINFWLLGRGDIRTSVFPSGHVTLGFSAAFAMLVAMPERRHVGLVLLLLAVTVTAATIYGRYHYAVDGLAAIGISLTTSAVAGLYWHGRRPV